MERVIGVQVNGKTVGTVTVQQDATEEQASHAALTHPVVLGKLGGGLSVTVVRYKINCIICLASGRDAEQRLNSINTTRSHHA